MNAPQARVYIGVFGFDLMGGAPMQRSDIVRVDPDGVNGVVDVTLCVAGAGDNRAVRVREGGEIVEEISPGEAGCSACALGGDDGKTLFLCTTRLLEEVRSQSWEAALLSVPVSVGHAGIP